MPDVDNAASQDRLEMGGRPKVSGDSAEDAAPARAGRGGPTYYGRSQLKASTFNEWLVGGYIFLAGLSGAAMLLAALGDAISGEKFRQTSRNGRYLSLLAPVFGAPLLIGDLHTPRRFYNMLRIAKRTSPMSIGTWILMGFSSFAGVGTAAEFLSRFMPRLRVLARGVQVPGAAAGVGLATYTATLLSATSTPLWAAAPRALAVRFAASSMAAGAAALALLERGPPMRRRLQGIAAVALTTELAATRMAHRIYEETGVSDAHRSGWGRVERVGVTGLGVLLPLGLLAASACMKGRPGHRLGTIGAVATLAGSALLRVSIIGLGDVSARRPEVSLRFSQPENLPDRAEASSIRQKLRRLKATLA